jgi:hypothetical protein
LSQPKYGLAARWHYLWIPSSFLKIFATENPGLSTAGSFALEGYRRKADKDNPSRTWEFAVGIGYQSMAPKDAYWLGNGKDPTQDADLVQAKNFYLITMDMGFTSRQYFSRYFGIHYGAGLGLGIVQGKILRTSAQQISDPNNPSNKHYEVRTPGGQVICDGQAKCNETLLSQSETHPPDQGPYQSSRFQETGVPPVIPIVNLMAGLDFPIPDANGLEFRLEFGLFDFLGIFAGATAGYAF